MDSFKKFVDMETARTSTDPNYDNATTLGEGGVHVALTDALVSYQMKPSDRLVKIVSATGEDATGLLYLPSVGEAAGNFYCIYAPTAATANDISVMDYVGGNEVSDMDADGDYVILFSNGIIWINVVTNVA